jgi:hypothetical protein
MTGPDELREEAEKARCMDYPQLAVMLDAAADDWEKLQDQYNGLVDIADGFYHRTVELVAENEKLEKRLEAAERERDLAVAHDRQPYPTAAAYEVVCAALEDKRKRLEAAEKVSGVDEYARRIAALAEDGDDWVDDGWSGQHD